MATFLVILRMGESQMSGLWIRAESQVQIIWGLFLLKDECQTSG